MAAPDPQHGKKKNKPSATADKSAASGGPASGNELDETHVPDSADAENLGATAVGESTSESAAVKSAPQPKQERSGTGKKKVTQLGDFRISKKLGKGGMGEVYLATQVSLDRKVALKTLSKELAKKEDFVKRFIREARSMAKIQHPNVVQVFAADSFKGVHFAAIEYVDGQSMQDWMNELGKLSVGDAVCVVLQCADGLGHAHELGMVHRDIKPDNILVTRKGEVKVADFGLAKVIDEDVSMTQSGTGLGTPLYMAPEQARNAKHVDQRCDIYALGCTLYYFLTGELPFRGDNTLELIMAKEAGKFTPARRLNPKVPERLDLMIDKMMAKDPKHRYADCNEIISDLQGLGCGNPTLSFIDADDRASVARRPAPARGGSTTSSPRQATRQITSTDDAARTAAQASKPAAEKMWIVQHTPAGGKPVIAKMTTAQVIQGVKGERIGPKAKAKVSVNDTFLPLAQYDEFASLMEKRAIRARANAKSTSMKETYEKLDRQDRRRKRWRWLRNLTDNVTGLIGLIIWLAVIAAAVYGLYRFGPVAFDWIKSQFSGS